MHNRFESLGFRVQLTEDEGVWVATARRVDNGDTFGPPVPADGADEAAELLVCWLEWQQAHTIALHDLQAAETIYHRLAADRFSGGGDTARAALRAALAEIDERRRRLDEIRGQRPWPH